MSEKNIAEAVLRTCQIIRDSNCPGDYGILLFDKEKYAAMEITKEFIADTQPKVLGELILDAIEQIESLE
ncbi:MAG: hypothetical protein KKD18_06245 [Nanoarchaeota archaeon]|nr:hypothetical protein [Nanoarchaeota archaeon]